MNETANIKNNREEEIKLLDLLLILWERKYLIIIGMMLTTICVFLYYRNIPTHYLISFVVERSDIKKPEYIINKSDKEYTYRVAKLNKYVINIIKANYPQKNIESKISKTSVILSFKTFDEKDGMMVMNQLLEDITNQDKKFIIGIRKKTKSIIKFSNGNIVSLRKMLKKYEGDLKNLNKIKTNIVQNKEMAKYNNIQKGDLNFLKVEKFLLDLIVVENEILVKKNEINSRINDLLILPRKLSYYSSNIKNIEILTQPNAEIIDANIKLKCLIGLVLSGLIIIFSVLLIELIANSVKVKK